MQLPKKAAAKRRPSQCGSHVSAAQLTDIARILDGFGEVLDGLVALDLDCMRTQIDVDLGGAVDALDRSFDGATQWAQVMSLT